MNRIVNDSAGATCLSRVSSLSRWSLATLFAVALMAGPAAAQTILIDYDDGDAGNGIHDASILDGGFEDRPVGTGATADRNTYGETDFWVNIATADQELHDFVRTNLENTTDQNAVVTDFADREAAVDTGHTLVLGDVFDFSYFWRDAFDWDDAGDQVEFTFYTTDDDLIGGSILNRYSFQSGLSTANETYEEVVDQFTFANPDDVGKNLFVSVNGLDGGSGADGFARVDDIFLQVTASVGALSIWTGGDAGTWNSGANWSTDPTIPNAANADVLFGAAGAASVVTVDSSVTVNSIAFEGSFAYDLATAVGQTVTIAESFSGAGDTEISAGSTTHEISGSLAGTVGFEKTGTGALLLSGDNSALSGQIAVTEGDLRTNNTSGLGSTTVDLADGTFLYIEGNDEGTGFDGAFDTMVTGGGEIRYGEGATTETVTIGSGTSGHTGAVTVRGGVTVVNDGGDLGTTDGTTWVNLATGQLQIDGSGGSVTLAETFNLGSRGTTDEAHLVNTGGSNTISGAINGTGGDANHIIGATAGTLTFDSGVTISDDNDAGTFVFQTEAGASIVNNGQITGAVDVVKQGAGTMSNGAGTWTGTTVIEGGTFEVVGTSWLSTSAITVREGATFAAVDNTGTRTLNIDQAIGGGGEIAVGGALRLFPDNAVTPGDEGIGTLNITGNMEFTGSGNDAGFAFELGDDNGVVGGSESDLVAVSGSLTLGGARSLSIVPVEGALEAGNYTIMTSSGLSGDASTTFSPVVTNTDGSEMTIRQTVSTANSGNNVVLTVTGSAEDVTWAGAAASGDGVWDIATSTNWTSSDSLYYDLDNATFDTIGGGDGTNDVTLDVAVTPASVTFDGSDDYNLTGVGGIQGTAAVVKNGSGTATLDTGQADDGDDDNGIEVQNTFSGGIDVNGGTFVLAGASSGITGDIDVADGAVFQIGIAGNTTGINHLPDPVDGVSPTPINTNTSGVVNVYDAENIANLTGSGTLNALQDGETVGVLSNSGFSGNMVVSAGTIEILNTDSGLGDTVGTTTVNDGGRLFVDDSVAEDINTSEVLSVSGLGSDGAEDGQGALQVGGPSTHTFNGAITLAASSTGVTEFRTGNAAGTMNVTGGVDGSAANESLRLSSLGTINVSGPVSLGSGGITKSSGGTATLSGALSYSGATTVSEGTLALAGAATPTGDINVEFDGTLDTTGLDGGLTIAGQTLTNNSNNTVVGDVTATAGSTVTGNGTYENNLSVESSTVQLSVNVPPPAATVDDILYYDNSEGPNAGGQFTGQTFTYTNTYTDVATGVVFQVDLTIDAGAGNELRTNGGTDNREFGVRAPVGVGNNAIEVGESVTATAPVVTIIDDAGLAPEDISISFDGFTQIVLYFTGNDGDAGRLTGDATTLFEYEGMLDPEGADFGDTVISVGSELYTYGNVGQSEVNTNNSLIDLSGSLPTTLVYEGITHTDSGSTAVVDPNRTRVDDYGVRFTVEVDAFTANTITVEGDFASDSASTLEVGIAGLSTFGSMEVLGAADFSGLIDVSVLGDYTPSINDEFAIVNVDGVLTASAFVANNGFVASVSGDGQSILLTYTGDSILPGDYNGDDVVDAADYTLWRDNLGAAAGSLGDNDTVGGTIGIAQYNLWSEYFGLSLTGGGSFATTTPEPGTAAMFALAGLTLAARRRRVAA